MESQEKVITYKGRIVFIKLSMPFFNRTLKHYVEKEACFMFVNKGRVNVRAADEYLELDRNNGMIAKCLNYFFEPSKDTEACKDGIESVGVFLYPSLVKDLFDLDLAQSDHKVNYNIQQVHIDQLLANYRESINLLLEYPELADETMVKTKLKEFVQLIVKSQNTPSQLDFLAALFKPNEVAFKRIIQENLYVNLSIDELAALSHLSLSSFKRKFKETFNESPKKYIIRKKIERAAELLLNTQERISHIAYDVGFDSVNTFNRNFTSFYGYSPSEYRLSQNEKSLS